MLFLRLGLHTTILTFMGPNEHTPLCAGFLCLLFYYNLNVFVLSKLFFSSTFFEESRNYIAINCHLRFGIIKFYLHKGDFTRCVIKPTESMSLDGKRLRIRHFGCVIVFNVKALNPWLDYAPCKITLKMLSGHCLLIYASIHLNF